MSRYAWSQAEEALRDTLIHKAERSAFVKIAEANGFTWPQSLAETAWRGALVKVTFNARDIFPVVFEALRRAFSGYSEVFTDCEYAAPNVIQRGAQWHEAYVYRYIRIGTTIYFSVGVDANQLFLSPYRTSYWSAADFTGVDGDAIERLEVLPFMTYERGDGPYYGPGTEDSYRGPNNTLEIELWPHVATDMGSYLLEPTEYETASQGTCPVDGGDVCTPEDMPNGAYMYYSDVDEIDTAAVGTQVLPFATINVVTTDSFAASGTLSVTSSDGEQTITYTGKTSTSFTGCTGGIGTILDNTPIRQISDALENVDEAYPIYLEEAAAAPEIAGQFDRLLPAGNHITMRSTERTWLGDWDT